MRTDHLGSPRVTTNQNGEVTDKKDYTAFYILGRVTAHKQTTDGTVYTTGYVYNLSGALIEETYPSGRKVRNSLNIDGDLSKVETQKAGGAWEIRADSFAYDSAGAVTAMRLGNNRWETAEYNSRLQVTRIGLGTAAGVQDVLRLDYGYATAGQTDNNGSLREQTITVPTVGANPGFTAVQSYGYDSLNRLQSASETVSGSQTWRQTFNYDRYGNRTFDAAGTTTLVQSNNVTNPVVNQANNRFSAGQGYNYDLAGNVTTNATGMQFVYDAENHQTEARDGGGFVVGQYFYDGEGKRVKKVSNTETTVFVYDGGGALVAEYSSQANPTAIVKYLTQDHLGSPRVITDQNGAVVSRTDFGAFGDETITPQRTSGLGYAAADGVRQDYTGYQKDDESGLEYAQARYYNPAHGRFTSIDPLTASASIRNPQTFNRYSYALNSPYKFTDPLGLLSISTGSCLPCKFADSGGGGGGVNPMGAGMFVLLRRDSAPVPDAHTNEAAEPAEATHEAVHAAQQQAESPPIPSTTDSACRSGHLCFGPQAGGATLGDIVYESVSSLLPDVRATVFPSDVPAIDVFVYTTDYYASFTARIAERSTGENRTGYSYEIVYDGDAPTNASQGRQRVADSGVIEIGNFRVRSQTTGPDQPLKPFYSGEIDFKRVGTITIYGTNGEKVGTSSFEATVKTVDGAVGDHRISIVETSRTVGNRNWNRPSP